MIRQTDKEPASLARSGFMQPEKYFSRISQIDIRRDLRDRGFDHVLLDIDNTIRSRADHLVPKDVLVWLGKARDAGISFCLLSNNWHKDIRSFASSLDLEIVAKAMKPLPFAFYAAMKKIGGAKKDTVVIGDQLLTDVIGAHFAGLCAYLVQPLVEVDLKHTVLLRNLENAILDQRIPEGVPSVAQVEVVEASDSGHSGKPI